MDKISLLAIADIHIGCPRIDPNKLADRLRKFLYPQIEGNQILFICGDFFDTLLTLNSRAAFVSMEVIREIKHVCRTNGCDLRILRGTPTHDRNQPRHFINGEDPNQTEVRLYDTVDIEHHERTGLDILYIPDNVISDNIYEDISKLLESHNLDHVDLLIHHGYFKHMLPEVLIHRGLPSGCLEAEKINKYVWGATLNGHVHVSSIYENVISIGSFDRLTHGEEEPKGFYQITIDKNAQHLITGEKCDIYQFKFIENTDANKFITFNLLSYDPQEALSSFKNMWNNQQKKFHDDETVRVRIISNDKSVIEGCSQIAKTTYENVLIDQSSVIAREQCIENVATNLEELPLITPENVCDLVVPIIKKAYPNVQVESVKKILESIGCKKDVTDGINQTNQTS